MKGLLKLVFSAKLFVAVFAFAASGTINAAGGSGATDPKASQSTRQTVMDDAATFFDAEPVKEYDSALRLQKDIGWYLKTQARIIGTFPARSAFRIVVKKGAKSLASVRCEGTIYTKAADPNLSTPALKREKDLAFEDFMTAGGRCFDEKAVIRETGELDVEIYFIDGSTNNERLLRKHRMDVRKATKVRGSASAPQPDVSDYYIQRHAESAVAIAYFAQGREVNYFTRPVEMMSTPSFRTLSIYTSYSPAEQTRLPVNPFAQCTVNGRKVELQNDRVRVYEGQGRREIGIYTDRIAAKFKAGPPYKDWVEFIDLTFQMPLFFSESRYSKPTMKIEDYPGKWECSVIENGVTFRTFRWEVGKDGILPHGEQRNGNINLFYDAALIEMDIPTGGSPIDARLLPVPNSGLFYGIAWSTPEGKAMAGRVPKLGSPYHVPSNLVK